MKEISVNQCLNFKVATNITAYSSSYSSRIKLLPCNICLRRDSKYNRSDAFTSSVKKNACTSVQTELVLTAWITKD